MAISAGTAVSREVSSKTQLGLGVAIARAYEDNIGYNSEGRVVRAGGSSASATIDFNWRGATPGTQQEFIVDIPVAHSAIGFVGVPTPISKVERGQVQDRTLAVNADPYRITVTLGGISVEVDATVQGGGSITGAFIAERVVVALGSSRFSGIVASASVTTGGTREFDIHYTAAARDLSIAGTIRLDSISNRGFVTNITGGYTVSATTTTEFSDISSGAVVTAEVVADVALPDGKVLTFADRSTTVSVAAGGSYNFSSVANQVIGMLRATDGFDSRSGLAGGKYSVKLRAGFGVSSLTIKLTRVRDGITTTHDIIMDTVSNDPGVVDYVAPVQETFGTLHITIGEPDGDALHTVSVFFPQNTPIAEVESLIEDAINDTIIGQDEDGADIRLSSVVKATVGDPSDTTDNGLVPAAAQLFTVTLNWTAAGVVPVVTVDISELIIAENGETLNDADVNTAFTNGSENSGIIPWKSVTTSSTLQPGDATTHFAVLVYIDTVDI